MNIEGPITVLGYQTKIAPEAATERDDLRAISFLSVNLVYDCVDNG